MSRAKSGSVIIDTAHEILQKEISTGRALASSDHGYTIFLTNAGAINITINTGLNDNFEADFIQQGAGTTTFVDGTATVTAPNGLVLTGVGRMASVVKRLAVDDVLVLGELTI